MATSSAQSAFAATGSARSAAEECDFEKDPNRCQYLFLYRAVDFGGDAEQFAHQPSDSCAALASPLTRGGGSVRNDLFNLRPEGGGGDTPGLAVVLFAGEGCTGASYRFSSGGSSRDLAALGFDAAVSVKFVTDPCRVYRDGAGRRQNLNVCVYADAEDAGEV
jgi:hypothetical protein